MGIKVNLRNVRTIWLWIWEKDEPKKNDNGKIGKGAYKAVICIPHDHPDVIKLDDAAREALIEKLKTDKGVDKWMERNYGIGNHDDKCAIKDVNERDNELEGFEDHLYITAKSFKQPRIQTSKGEDQNEPGLTIEGDEIEGKEIYSGCYCNVSLEIYCWSNENGKGINANLLGLRFRDDGDAFGGGSKETASDDDLGDEDESPRGRKSSSKPKSRRDRDDEDDTPRRSSRSRRDRDDEDDEPEERPRRSRRDRDDGDDEPEERPRRSRR